MAIYKQKCSMCKKNYVIVIGNQRFPLCYDCQKDELKKPIKNKKMQKLFDIPEEYYKENSFLRNIKIAYIRYGKLTEKQEAAFKKVVDKMKSPAK